MPDRFLETHIRQLPLFANVPAEHLHWITEGFRVMRVEPGELVFKQGEPTAGLYMIVMGQAQLIQSSGNGPARVIGELGANQYVNEAALFRESVETASLRVLESTTILHLPRSALMNIIAHHPDIKHHVPIPIPAIAQQARERAFRGQRENETVLLDTRRHWWAFVSKLWLPFLLALAGAIFGVFLPVAGLTIAFSGFMVVVAAIIAIYFYLEWRNDHVIISDQRVIRIERIIHRFSTSIHEVPLTSIHEINADVVTADPFSRLFNYGTVELKTAGEAGNIELTLISRPNVIQDMIFEQRRNANQRAERDHRNTIRATVDRVLGHEPEFPGQQDARSSVRRRRSFSPIATNFVNDKGDSIYRKHLSVYFQSIAVPGFFVLVSALVLLLAFSIPGLRDFGVLGPVFAFFLFLAALIWLYWVDWDWRNDIYVVSDDTIQLIHKRPLWLQNEHDQVLLSSVDNVVSEKGGFFANLFDYGDVRISLIGGDKDDAKVFRQVQGPQAIQAEITRRQARFARRQDENRERRRREEIADYLSVYHETINQGTSAHQVAQVYDPDNPPPPRPVYDRMRPPKVPRMRREGLAPHENQS